MQEILKIIDGLIRKCDNCHSELTYYEIAYEMDELLVSLVGKNHNSYRNFISVIQSKSGYISKTYSLTGILLGIKSYLAIAKNTKKYQVFISSTYLDLIRYRQAVSDEITFRGHIPAGMELFKAGNESQLKTIYKWIDNLEKR